MYPETTIPSSANAAQKTGSCDTENAVFTLEWTSLDTSYSLSISFEVNGDAYKMKEISGFRMTGISFYNPVSPFLNQLNFFFVFEFKMGVLVVKFRCICQKTCKL